MVELLERWDGELVVSAFAATEADYLILTRLGVDVQVAFVADLADAYRVDSLDPTGLALAADICDRYRDLEVGLADSSMVVLADRWSTTTVATLDERHFHAITPLADGSFRLLPADGRAGRRG